MYSYASKFQAFEKRVEAAQMKIVVDTPSAASADNISFRFLQTSGAVSYSTMITDFADTEEADVVVLGHKGHAHDKAAAKAGVASIGSVTSSVAKTCFSTTLIVKVYTDLLPSPPRMP